MTKFRKGDRVSIKGVVTYDQADGKENIFVHVGADDVYVLADEVEMVSGRIEVGDTVRHGSRLGDVQAIHGGMLWVRFYAPIFGTPSYDTIEIGAVERFDQPTSSPAAPPMSSALADEITSSNGQPPAEGFQMPTQEWLEQTAGTAAYAEKQKMLPISGADDEDPL